MKKNRSKIVNDRWDKKEDKGRQISDKHLEKRAELVKPLTPLNQKQKEYMTLITNKKLVLATGLAGTSKTYIPTVMACDMFREGLIEKIYITRPNISNSKSLGYFGGSLIEKMANWTMPIMAILSQRLERGMIETALKRGQIVFVPMEVIKGMSFETNSFTICDEAEDLSIQEVKKLTTRQGGGIMVLCGDVSQSELSEYSGLKKLMTMAKNNPSLKGKVGMVDFNDPKDIVRSEECRDWVIAWESEEKKTK